MYKTVAVFLPLFHYGTHIQNIICSDLFVIISFLVQSQFVPVT